MNTTLCLLSRMIELIVVSVTVAEATGGFAEVGQIGEGATGKVYKGEMCGLSVAIKAMPVVMATGAEEEKGAADKTHTQAKRCMRVAELCPSGMFAEEDAGGALDMSVEGKAKRREQVTFRSAVHGGRMLYSLG